MYHNCRCHSAFFQLLTTECLTIQGCTCSLLLSPHKEPQQYFAFFLTFCCFCPSYLLLAELCTHWWVVDGFDIRLTFFKDKNWQWSLFPLCFPSLTLSINSNSSALVPSLFPAWTQTVPAASSQKFWVPSIFCALSLRWGDLLWTMRQWKQWQGRISCHKYSSALGWPCLTEGMGFDRREGLD